jgi:hypothetical protein
MSDHAVSSSTISRPISAFSIESVEIAHYRVVTLSYTLGGVNTWHKRLAHSRKVSILVRPASTFVKRLQTSLGDNFIYALGSVNV